MDAKKELNQENYSNEKHDYSTHPKNARITW
jgi:hypothetical protein